MHNYIKLFAGEYKSLKHFLKKFANNLDLEQGRVIGINLEDDGGGGGLINVK